MRALIVDALVALLLVLAASGAGIAFNLISGRGIDPFEAYTGYGEKPLPSPESPDPLPAVGINRPIPVDQAQVASGVLFVDARTAEEFAQGHIPDAASIPYSLMRLMPAEQGGGYSEDEIAWLKSACTVVIYDAGDGSAESLQAGLREQIPVLRVLQGGVAAWREAGGAWSGGGS